MEDRGDDARYAGISVGRSTSAGHLHRHREVGADDLGHPARPDRVARGVPARHVLPVEPPGVPGRAAEPGLRLPVPPRLVLRRAGSGRRCRAGSRSASGRCWCWSSRARVCAGWREHFPWGRGRPRSRVSATASTRATSPSSGCGARRSFRRRTALGAAADPACRQRADAPTQRRALCRRRPSRSRVESTAPRPRRPRHCSWCSWCGPGSPGGLGWSFVLWWGGLMAAVNLWWALSSAPLGHVQPAVLRLRRGCPDHHRDVGVASAPAWVQQLGEHDRDQRGAVVARRVRRLVQRLGGRHLREYWRRSAWSAWCATAVLSGCPCS